MNKSNQFDESAHIRKRLVSPISLYSYTPYCPDKNEEEAPPPEVLSAAKAAPPSAKELPPPVAPPHPQPLIIQQQKTPIQKKAPVLKPIAPAALAITGPLRPPKKTVAFGRTTNITETVLKAKENVCPHPRTPTPTPRINMARAHDNAEIKKQLSAQKTELDELRKEVADLRVKDQKREEDLRGFRRLLADLSSRLMKVEERRGSPPPTTGAAKDVAENSAAAAENSRPMALVVTKRDERKLDEYLRKLGEELKRNPSLKDVIDQSIRHGQYNPAPSESHEIARNYDDFDSNFTSGNGGAGSSKVQVHRQRMYVERQKIIVSSPARRHRQNNHRVAATRRQSKNVRGGGGTPVIREVNSDEEPDGDDFLDDSTIKLRRSRPQSNNLRDHLSHYGGGTGRARDDEAESSYASE